MSTLLDTSVVVEWLRKQPAAIAHVKRLRDKPSVSVVTLAEIEIGVRSPANERDADAFFGLTHVLPIGREIAKHAGSLLRHYGASHSVDLPDALIAATAEHHALKLATLNLKHFPMLPGLKRPY
jgi:hypothetical protein